MQQRVSGHGLELIFYLYRPSCSYSCVGTSVSLYQNSEMAVLAWCCEVMMGCHGWGGWMIMMMSGDASLRWIRRWVKGCNAGLPCALVLVLEAVQNIAGEF